MVIRVYFKYNKAVKRVDSRGLTPAQLETIVHSLNSLEEYISIGESVIVCKKEILCILFYDD